jgi:signal peptidase
MNNNRTIRWLGNLLLALLITIVLYVLVSHYVLGFNFVTVYGSSMSPTIPQGALMVTRAVAPSEVAVRDIIAFRPPGGTTTTVAHRVVEIELSENTVLFTTKGDAVENDDSYAVPAANLLGKVTYWIPFVGRIAHSIRTVPGFALLVLTPMVLLIIFQVRGLIGMRSSKSGRHLSSIEKE